jgi:DNA (cytosine-5)-methyltransferase 1
LGSLVSFDLRSRQKPLVEATLRRVARGIRRFVLDARTPFVVPDQIVPTLIQTGYGERKGQAPRILDIGQPLGTVVAGGAKHALVAAYLAKHYGGHESTGSSLTLPIATITTQDHHALVAVSSEGAHREDARAFLARYEGKAKAQLSLESARRPGIVTVRGVEYTIADIGQRMLQPRELFRAQGFADSYVIDRAPDGGPLSKTAQIRLCGNSVCPPIAAALVAANLAGEEVVAA